MSEFTISVRVKTELSVSEFVLFYNVHTPCNQLENGNIQCFNSKLQFVCFQLEKKFGDFVDNVLTEPVECFLCLKPFAHMYESKYQRMPCIGAQTNLDPIHEVYMNFSERFL